MSSFRQYLEHTMHFFSRAFLSITDLQPPQPKHFSGSVDQCFTFFSSFSQEAIGTIITGAVHTKTANEKTFRNLGEWWIKLSQSTSTVAHLTVQKHGLVRGDFTRDFAYLAIRTAPVCDRRRRHTKYRCIGTERVICLSTVNTKKHGICCTGRSTTEAGLHP